MVQTNYPFIIQSKTDKIYIVPETMGQETSSDVASYPVEGGNSITDNARFNSNEFSVSGLIFGKDLKDCDRKCITLHWMQRLNMIVSVHGLMNDPDYMIISFKKEYANGYGNAVRVDLTLRNVRMPKSSFVGIKNSGKKQPSQPSGTYLTVVSGNTYWGWSQRYGTSIQQLRDWNHWPDRFIPIGAKARVK